MGFSNTLSVEMGMVELEECSYIHMFALQANYDDCVECLVSKQLLFHSLPQILILHIKRFHLGEQVTKNNRHIDFPLDLDLAPFCTKNCQVSKA